MIRLMEECVMLQKLVIGVLILTVVGAAGVGVYDALRAPAAEDLPITETLDTETNSEPVVTAETAAQNVDTAQDTPVAEVVAVDSSDPGTQTHSQNQVGQTDAVGSGPVQENAAVDMVGEAWSASGTILSFDTAGFTLALDDGSEVYVELGPAMYWQAQPVTLTEGDVVSVNGFNNGEQIHAGTVTTASGEQMALRSAEGAPLWSGGAQGNGAGEAGGGTEGAQVAADEWLTISGTVTGLQGAKVIMTTTDGEVLEMSMGQPRFSEEQGVTFALGDAIDVVGFWEGEQFQPGEIKKVATGERLMLRDPNGRPLWAGPGRTGEAEGNQGAGQGQASDQQAQGQGQQGQGQQGQGQGNGGGNNGQAQVPGVPSSEWITLNGNVIDVEPLAITIQTDAGETVRVALGEVDFWTEQGYVFVIPEAVTVDGYWLGTQFEAGTLTFGDGTGTLYIRDALGDLLWTMSAGNGQGQGDGGNGRQYRGGRS